MKKFCVLLLTFIAITQCITESVNKEVNYEFIDNLVKFGQKRAMQVEKSDSKPIPKKNNTITKPKPQTKTAKDNSKENIPKTQHDKKIEKLQSDLNLTENIIKQSKASNTKTEKVNPAPAKKVEPKKSDDKQATVASNKPQPKKSEAVPADKKSEETNNANDNLAKKKAQQLRITQQLQDKKLEFIKQKKAIRSNYLKLQDISNKGKYLLLRFIFARRQFLEEVRKPYLEKLYQVKRLYLKQFGVLRDQREVLNKKLLQIKKNMNELDKKKMETPIYVFKSDKIHKFAMKNVAELNKLRQIQIGTQMKFLYHYKCTYISPQLWRRDLYKMIPNAEPKSSKNAEVVPIKKMAIIAVKESKPRRANTVKKREMFAGMDLKKDEIMMRKWFDIKNDVHNLTPQGRILAMEKPEKNKTMIDCKKICEIDSRRLSTFMVDDNKLASSQKLTLVNKIKNNKIECYNKCTQIANGQNKAIAQPNKVVEKKQTTPQPKKKIVLVKKADKAELVIQIKMILKQQCQLAGVFKNYISKQKHPKASETKRLGKELTAIVKKSELLIRQYYSELQSSLPISQRITKAQNELKRAALLCKKSVHRFHQEEEEFDKQNSDKKSKLLQIYNQERKMLQNIAIELKVLKDSSVKNANSVLSQFQDQEEKITKEFKFTQNTEQTQIAKPITKPVEPITKPVEPITKPVEQITKPVQPITKPFQPITKPVEPITKPTQPRRLQQVAKPKKVSVQKFLQLSITHTRSVAKGDVGLVEDLSGIVPALRGKKVFKSTLDQLLNGGIGYHGKSKRPQQMKWHLNRLGFKKKCGKYFGNMHCSVLGGLEAMKNCPNGYVKLGPVNCMKPCPNTQLFVDHFDRCHKKNGYVSPLYLTLAACEVNRKKQKNLLKKKCVEYSAGKYGVQCDALHKQSFKYQRCEIQCPEGMLSRKNYCMKQVNPDLLN